MRKVLFLFLMAAVLPMALHAQGGCITSLPWNDDFESCTDVGGNSLPDCWTRVASMVNGNATYPNVYNYGSSYGKVLNFNGQCPSSTPSGVISVATPLIPAPLNSLEFSFSAYKNGLRVYIATDPTDVSTYIFVGSYSPGYVWQTYEVHTDTLTTITSQGYIIFQGTSSSTYGQYSNAYVDNVNITTINSCEKPAIVNVSQVGPSSAHIAWSSINGAQGYAVNYSTTGAMAGSQQVVVSNNNTTLTNLTPNTDYTVWVRTICRPGDTSDTRSNTFTTELSCYSIRNLVQVGSGLDAASYQWEMDGRGNTATGVWTVLHDLTDPSVPDVAEMSTGATSHIFTGLDRSHEYTATFYTVCGAGDTSEALTITVNFRHCGESALHSSTSQYMGEIPFSTAYGTSFSQVLYDADVLYSMDTIRGIAYHRRLSENTSALNRYLTIFIGHSTLDSLTSSVSTTGLQMVAQHVLYQLPAQEWDTLLFTTPFVYDGHSNVLVVVEDSTQVGTSLSAAANWWWHSTESKTYYKFGTSSITGTYKQPDIRFVGACNSELTCEPPAVVVSSTSSDQATITWYGDNTMTYYVEYRIQGGTTWTTSSSMTNVSSYTIQNLTPATYYEVRLGVECGTTIRYSSPINFSTECALFHLPFDFTQTDMIAAADNGFAECWNFSSVFLRGRLTDSHRGYVRNGAQNQWFMLPAIAEPLNGARLRTWVASSDEGSFAVGIASLDDCSDVVWVDTVAVPAGNPNTSHDEYISYLDTYTGTGNRVVVSPIVNNAFHFIYFFDFHVEAIPDCRPIAELTYDSSDASSITCHWAPRGGTQWAIYANNVLKGTSNTPNYTVTGLQPFTNYDITVRPICGVGDTGEAVTERFKTGCAGDECYIDIVGHSSSGDGWNGGRLELVAANSTLCVFTLRQGSYNTHTERICANMHMELNWLSGNADEVCSFEVINSNGDTLYATSYSAMDLPAEFYETDTPCAGGGSVVQYYTVTVQSSDINRGTVSGSNSYLAGSTAQIQAYPNSGFEFERWNDNDTTNPRNITVTGDMTFIAYFVPTQGIEDIVEDGVTLAVRNGRLLVSGAEGRHVALVDALGRTLYSGTAKETLTIDIPETGVYLLRVDEQPTRRIAVVK